jgi:RNAse (barnase) inhibitor barstar
MNQLLEIITEKTPNIYQLKLDISQKNLSNFCQQNNFQLCYLDGINIKNKQEFFQGCISAFNLPEYFGNNWDACFDCLTDLSWCPANSYLFYYQNYQNFATNSPEDWDIFLDILQEAISHWKKQKIPFFVILST